MLTEITNGVVRVSLLRGRAFAGGQVRVATEEEMRKGYARFWDSTLTIGECEGLVSALARYRCVLGEDNYQVLRVFQDGTVIFGDPHRPQLVHPVFLVQVQV